MKQVVLIFALALFLPLAVTEIAPSAANASDMSSQRARVFPYCSRGGPEGGMRCQYNSRASCTKAVRGRGGSCIPNPRLARS